MIFSSDCSELCTHCWPWAARAGCRKTLEMEGVGGATRSLPRCSCGTEEAVKTTSKADSVQRKPCGGQKWRMAGGGSETQVSNDLNVMLVWFAGIKFSQVRKFGKSFEVLRGQQLEKISEKLLSNRFCFFLLRTAQNRYFLNSNLC